MPERSFTIVRLGERIEALAPGVDRKHLDRLRRGELEIEAELDLHSLTAPEAERALRAALEEALAEGMRCVMVVHGRGLRSPAGPVLKEAVVQWLTTPPLAARVLAFASARPKDGGPGATCVLLRRTRAR